LKPPPTAEKIRLILDYKQLPYRKIEVTPGVGQIDVFRLSGQRQVPVLKDNEQVIADSTAIALYLEKAYPERPLIPMEPRQQGGYAWSSKIGPTKPLCPMPAK
jgi:glutathione S-transferase